MTGSPQSKGRVLIAGCGFVGLAAARLLHRDGWEVLGCTHSSESSKALAGEPFPVVACDISDRESLARLRHSAFEVVIHAASSGRGGVDQYRRVYYEGAENLINVLQPKRLIFTSSTSVYAQIDGSVVTEDSLAEPQRETGKILRQTEELVVAAGGCVARLAGIYGPGRSVLLRKFLSGEAVIEDSGERWINQIHRDDAASALLVLVNAGASGVFNVSDDTPLSQRNLYERLAEKFHRAVPPFGPVDLNRKRAWTHKQVSNAKLRSLGWQPRYPSFFDAIAHDSELVAGAS